MLFSVIIPTYNRRELLERTLDSVRAQRFTDYEVVVVDDGSTDGTMEMLRSQHPQVRVFAQSQRGPGAARNLGIREAGGGYAAFLDSDDVWFPWTLEIYAQVITQNDRPSFVTGRPFRFEQESQLSEACEEKTLTVRFADYLASGDEWRWWGVSSFVIRLDALRATGGFVEANINGEDGDLALKLGAAPGFVQITAPATFGYREHGGNVTGDLAKSVAGTWIKVRAEKTGGYPGGGSRARERREIITRHLRAIALGALQRGPRSEAWALYRAAFGWHLALGRWKFLAAFPLAALLAVFQAKVAARTGLPSILP